MHLLCPYCHSKVELLDEASLTDISCLSCGKRFSLVSDDTTAPFQAVRADEGTPAEKRRWLGHFELDRQLGMGKFGRVWLARDRELHRQVAIKIPRQSQLDEDETEFFLREARAAAQLKHPGIVSVHEVGREDETVYIVSDYIEGANLKEWLSGQRLTSREAAEMVVQIARALDHAHRAGVVHRDLKPGNILMDLDGQPHIADFGLAKRDSGEITMTLAGNILGTPAYMPPEQARGAGHTADRRSDVYSLGVILFELLSGELPFRGDQQMLLSQILRDEPPTPRKFNARLSRDLETITLKCLEKDPDRRYPSAAALGDDLERHLRGEAIHARPIGRVEHAWRWVRRNPALASMGAVAALLLVTVTVVSTVAAWQIRAAQVETQSSLDQTRTTIDDLFTSVSEEVLLDELGMQDLREKLLKKAGAHYELLVARHPADRDLAELARAHFRLGEIERLLDRPKEAEAAYRRALEIHNKLATSTNGDRDLRVALADTQNGLAITMQQDGNHSQAQRFHERVLELREQLAEEGDPELRRKVASVLMNLAIVHHEQGQHEVALEFLEQAQEKREQLLQEGHAEIRDAVVRDLAMGHYNGALMHQPIAVSNDDEGRKARREIVRECDLAIEQFGAYLEGHSRELNNRHKQALCYLYKGNASDDIDEALQAYADGEAILTPLAERNPSVLDYRCDSARLQTQRGRCLYGDALKHVRKKKDMPASQLSDAAASLSSASDALDELVAEKPDEVRFHEALVDCLFWSVEVSRLNADKTEYQGRLLRLRDALAALVALTGDESHQQMLTRVESMLQ